MSGAAGRHYPYSTIRDKLSGGRKIDWIFVRTIVTVCHRYAKSPGEPDLESWRRSFEQARRHAHWVGSIPSVADKYQTRRRIAAELSDGMVPGRAFVLTGLGGVGKTQLAADLVHRSWVDHEVDLVVWVTALSRRAIVAAYAEAARRLGIASDGDEDAAAERLLAWLTEPHGRRWLVVLDDVQDPADLTGLWPPVVNGNTVVTTRAQQAALAGSGRTVMPVDAFEPGESVRYLREKLDGEGLDDYAELADELGHLPLALAEAAAYIQDLELDCADYLRRFRERRLADVELDTPPDGHGAALTSTWNLSIANADAHRPGGVARPLLELASVLSPHGIPAAVFTTEAVQAMVTERRGRSTGADDARDGLSNLKLLSLCVFDDDRSTVRVHQLVQRVTREALPGPAAGTARCAADALLAIWPEVERDTTFVGLLRENTAALRRNAEDALWCGGALHEVVFRAGNSLTLQGLPAAALAYWQGLLPCAVGRLGDEHPDTLSIRNNLAWAGHRTGDSAPALAELREVLSIRRRVLGDEHPNTLATIHGIARFQAEVDDLDGAVGLLRGLVVDYERVLGPDARDTLNTRLLLDSLLGETESPDVAVTRLRALLDHYVRVPGLGAGHPETLDVELELVGWLVEAGTTDEARTRIVRLCDDYRQALGPDHVDTLRARYLAASLLGRQGGRIEAADAMQGLLDDVQRLLDRGRTEAAAVREWIEQWSADAPGG